MRVLALDIGGTSIKSGLYTEDGICDLRETYTNAKLGGHFVMERVKERFYQLYGKNNVVLTYDIQTMHPEMR